jgi:hypothetical protein
MMLLRKSPFLPDPQLFLEWFQRNRYRKTQQREEQGRGRQWFVLAGPAARESLLNPQPARLGQLLPPDDRSWADPFLWQQKNDPFLFCEEWLKTDPHAHIAVMRLSAEGKAVSPSQPILKKPYHLSYPFLFQHEGALYMMPEGGAGRAVEVFQCEEFPHSWRPKVTLMRDLKFADATLLEREGKWWLFITIKRGVFALNRDLFVFSADTPLTDKWRPHPCNPVVRGIQCARPAGPVFELGGKWFRPSQNCLVRYGHSLRINEIVHMDNRHYEERLVTEVGPDWQQGIRATHHINWRDGLLVMDAQRLLPANHAPA